jgi:hypothetical protein
MNNRYSAAAERFSAALLAGALAAGCSGAATKPVEPGEAGKVSFGAPVPIVQFNVAEGNNPEGIDIKNGIAYVSISTKSTAIKVDLSSGGVTELGTLPKSGPGGGIVTGLNVDENGDVVVGLASPGGDPAPGLYRIPSSGGAATLYASKSGIIFPNDFTRNGAGDLFFSDAFAGVIARIPKGSHTPEIWSSSELFKSQKDFCGSGVDSFDVGINGIVYHDGQIYAVNTTKATLLRIPVGTGGAAGTPEVVAGPDCKGLGGADGIKLLDDRTFIVALNRQNKISMVKLGGDKPLVEVAVEDPILDFPASLSVVTEGTKGVLYVTNGAFLSGTSGKPSLVKIPFSFDR